MRKLLAVLALILVGCSSPAPKQVASSGLAGSKLGSDFIRASEAEKLSYCKDSVKAYKTSGVQSFSVSPSIGNITPQRFCGQLDEYFADAANHSERLAQASATAMVLYSSPATRKEDAELSTMEKR
ncbi:MAG: hypothetical protein H7Y22_03410 [Gemmatimonadaceae bacterium]|nr:hypothetical protein [Gloeobacterales cyanobacterium ES-bin-141]